MYPDIKSAPRIVPGLAHLFYRPEPKKRRPAGARYSLDRVEHRVEDMPRAETPRGRGPYGVDTGYFDRKLARVIPALDNYTPGDLAREFARMAAVADRDAALAELSHSSHDHPAERR